jgi:hypothetical protein
MRSCHFPIALAIALSAILTGVAPAPAFAQEVPAPYLADRGTGIATSQFGTYVLKGELLVYPFFEYYINEDQEYKPEELGFLINRDFEGKYRASEALIFLAYGVTDRLAVELEAAAIRATLDKSPDDPSPMPERLSESGIGDIQAELRWRWLAETARRPEIWSYYEISFPSNKDKPLIGTPQFEHKLGAGVIKGFPVGTFTLRAAMESTGNGIEPGEFAIEYLKRLSDRSRIYTGIEGVQDEVEWIVEFQRQLRPGVVLKFNNAFGITPKAADWAPEIGVLFSFGGKR